MGWVKTLTGGAVNDDDSGGSSNPLNTLTNPGQAIANAVGLNPSNLGGSGALLGPMGLMAGALSSGGNQPTNQFGEGLDPNAEAIRKQQIEQAKQFRSNLPALQSQMAQRLAANANRNLGKQVGAIQDVNTRRGLSYGGINEGMKQSAKAQSQSQLAGQVSDVNQQLYSAADQLDANALKTGSDIQAQQQQIQNQIYQQAVNQQNAQTQMFGSLAGLGLLAAIV